MLFVKNYDIVFYIIILEENKVEDADSDADANLFFIKCDKERHSHLQRLHMAMPFAVYFPEIERRRLLSYSNLVV